MEFKGDFGYLRLELRGFSQHIAKLLVDHSGEMEKSIASVFAGLAKDGSLEQLVHDAVKRSIDHLVADAMKSWVVQEALAKRIAQHLEGGQHAR